MFRLLAAKWGPVNRPLLEITKVPYLQHYDDPRCLDEGS